MKINILPLATVALATVSLLLTGCEDDVSQIGNSISSAEVSINIDSVTYKLKARTVEAPDIDLAANYTLLGSINVPEYGSLDCSYVTQFLPAENLTIPDTITPEKIDSVKMILSVPKVFITGDSLAPQQLKVYDLERQLPSDLTASFDPEGYYDSSAPISTKSYTLSGYTYNDTTYTSAQIIPVSIKLPLEKGRDLYAKYLEDPEIFVWPELFAQYWPGVYIAPSFGKGCVAPISSTNVYLYYPATEKTTTTDSDGNTVVENKIVPDSLCVLASAPEVITDPIIKYTPSANLESMIADGKNIITTPGGYTVSFSFPAREVLEEYWKGEYDLGVINNMVFTLPAKAVNNSYSIGVAPALLMVKTSEVESFFSEGRLPDNKSSFYSLYSSDAEGYTFSSMREYIVDLKAKGEDNITEEDVDFTLIPISATTEDYTNPSTGALSSVITSLSPYIVKPTMTLLETDNAKVVFTYSNQTLN